MAIFVFIVSAVAPGVFLGQLVTVHYWRQVAIRQGVQVETRDLPIEETMVKSIATSP
ncbi:MAG: hypothetical protein OXG33_01535 [Chloroflexi bacterium]|nr:hypothetical protein [Chloroflexota bacterium]